MENKKISVRQLERFPQYLNFLLTLRNSNINKVSSKQMAEVLNCSEEQVRKDLQIVSPKSGRPGCQRNVDELIASLKEYLGYNKSRNAVIVGIGHLGSAFMAYRGFEDYGLNIVAGFDINPALVGSYIADKPIYSIFNLNNIIKELDVDVAILTTSKEAAQECANKLANSNIKAIWNFVPVHLEVANNIVIENVDLARSLAVLSHRLNK